jgi:valyl-tRNA synthetase
VSHRAFLNKVWNAARFALSAASSTTTSTTSSHDELRGDGAGAGVQRSSDGGGASGIDGHVHSAVNDSHGGDGQVNTISVGEGGAAFAPSRVCAADGPADLPDLNTLPARWIVSRLAATVCESNAALESFNFSQFTTVLFDFWVHDLCDTYIELAKKDLRGDDVVAAQTTRTLLVSCVAVATRLLAPAAPFITDAILEVVPRRGASINDQAEANFSDLPSNDHQTSDKQAQNEDGATSSAHHHHHQHQHHHHHHHHQEYPQAAEWGAMRSEAVERRMANALELARAIRALPVRQIDPHARLAAFARPRCVGVCWCIRTLC